MAKKKSKSKISTLLMEVALVGAGGVIGSQITGIMERTAATAPIGKFRPAVTALLGLGIYYFTSGVFQKIGLGISGQGIAETIEGFVMTGPVPLNQNSAAAASSAAAVQGLRMGTTNPQLQPGGTRMGFAPQVLPKNAPNPVMYKNVPMR